MYFDGCPNFQPTMELVSRTMKDLGIKDSPVARKIDDESEAREERFLGSPTVQINGMDIEVGRRDDVPLYGCRIYQHGTDQSGIPPRELIVTALKDAASQEE